MRGGFLACCLIVIAALFAPTSALTLQSRTQNSLVQSLRNVASPSFSPFLTSVVRRLDATVDSQSSASGEPVKSDTIQVTNNNDAPVAVEAITKNEKPGDSPVPAAVGDVISEGTKEDPRTATGGIINTLMVLLSIFAVLGNGAFLVYVFLLSK